LIILLLSLGIFVTPVKAQQQTGQVTTGTDNPQNSLVELFNQEESTQTTGDEQLLNKNTSRILIPEGKPILGSSSKNKKSNNLIVMLSVIIMTAVTGAAILFVYYKTVNIPSSIITVHTEQQTEETQIPITQQEVAVNKIKRKLRGSRKKRKKRH